MADRGHTILCDKNRDLVLRTMAAADLDEAASIVAEAFASGDPMALALGLTVADMRRMLDPLLRQNIADGLSVVACDGLASGRVVGCLLSERFGGAMSEAWDEDIQDRFAPIFRLLEELDSSFFSAFPGHDPKDYLHECMLACHPDAGGRGVGSALLRASAEVGRRHRFRGAIAEATGRSRSISLSRNLPTGRWPRRITINSPSVEPTHSGRSRTPSAS